MALPRPSSMPSIGSASVSPTKRAGSSSTSPTVVPARSGSSNGSSTLASSTPFAHFSSVDVASLRRHAARHEPRLPGGNPCSALRGALGRQTLPLLRAQPVEGLLLQYAQRRAGGDRVEHVPGDDPRPPRGRILMQRRLDHRRPFEHQPLTRADHTVDYRTLQQLAGGTDIHPAVAAEPAAHVQLLQEPHRIGTVREHHIAVQAAGPGERRAGIGAAQPGAGRQPQQLAVDASAGITDTSAAQKPPAARAAAPPRAACLSCRSRTAPARAARPVDEVLGRSGDGVVGGDAGNKRGLGDDADLVGQIVVQCAERNGRCEARPSISAASSPTTADPLPLRAPARHVQALPSLAIFVGGSSGCAW